MNKQDKQTKTHRHTQQYSGHQRERWAEEAVKGKVGQIHGKGGRFDFEW